MARFELFVVFAEMRTGSNLLEANLNAIPGLCCHGEAFNPNFIGWPGAADILGVTLDRRMADPAHLLGTIRAQPGKLGGFRYFHDHDPRVFDLVMADPAVAKIVLTRNPLESYISRKIAAATGQWKLTNARHARTETVRFDAAEFISHLTALQGFQLRLLRALQESGQTAFWLDYEDVQEVSVLNGLAAFLGVPGRLEGLDRKLKKQNPEPLTEKVSNPEEMARALAGLDRFNLWRTPNFEPRRGAAVPTYLAAASAPLLYLPVRSGPVEAVRAWMAALDDGLPPEEGLAFPALRRWKAARPGYRSFTVLRHPLARAHAAFCDCILGPPDGPYADIREALRRHFGLSLPADGVAAPLADEEHGRAFELFLRFLKANLGGQTGLRVDPAWASQQSLIQGFAQHASPDMILREETLVRDLGLLAALVGRAPPGLPRPADPHAPRLAAILTPALEALAREAYARDYAAFGFGPWRRS